MGYTFDPQAGPLPEGTPLMYIPAPGGGTQVVSADSAAGVAWAGSLSATPAEVIFGATEPLAPGIVEVENAKRVLLNWSETAEEKQVLWFAEAIVLPVKDCPGTCGLCRGVTELGVSPPKAIVAVDRAALVALHEEMRDAGPGEVVAESQIHRLAAALGLEEGQVKPPAPSSGN